MPLLVFLAKNNQTAAEAAAICMPNIGHNAESKIFVNVAADVCEYIYTCISVYVYRYS